MLPITLPVANTSIVSSGAPRPRNWSVSPTVIVLWEISKEGGMRVAVIVAVGINVAVAVGVATTVGAATMSCNGMGAGMTVPSARNAWTLTI